MQVFSVPVEEQRLKEMSEQQFGERGRLQTRICSDIMARTGIQTFLTIQTIDLYFTLLPENILFYIVFLSVWLAWRRTWILLIFMF